MAHFLAITPITNFDEILLFLGEFYGIFLHVIDSHKQRLYYVSYAKRTTSIYIYFTQYLIDFTSLHDVIFIVKFWQHSSFNHLHSLIPSSVNENTIFI